jgi:thiol-disulfide isomerase/thioredoxin
MNSPRPSVLRLLLVSLTLGFFIAHVHAAAEDYTGKLDTQLVVDENDYDQVVLKPFRDRSKIKFATPLEEGANVTAGRLYHPPQDKSAILTLLVEPEDDTPFLLADLNLDNVMADDERFPLVRAEDDNPYILQARLQLPLKESLFAAFPVSVKYFKETQWTGLKEGERMLLQSKNAFATGKVTIADRPTLVQYGFNPSSRKISATKNWIGVDGDGDGTILMDRLSPEAAQAQDESIVFRVGSEYVSTKKVDTEKNVITLRSHPASDYKRVELIVGSELPDFQFTDFKGKKRRFAEFRGKHVLLDFWATWCPPCREELPYLKHAYQKFQAREFEIIGMNNDIDYTVVKPWLEKNGLTWTQATPDSIRDVMRALRITSFPTTILVAPDGKIVSLSQRNTKQPSLRGKDLIESLDDILEP